LTKTGALTRGGKGRGRSNDLSMGGRASGSLFASAILGRAANCLLREGFEH